jgi:NAD(P)-dependent dehydrogenase (short-subunit alcohol dehydrogenase family)/tRNA G18 (ribose-2'-O)-methylase SpoU
MPRDLRVTARNASFQQWQALLSNRKKRQRAGEFVVHGVRPVTLAVRNGWPVRALIYDMDRPLSTWAAEILADSAVADRGTQRVAMAGELLHELGEKAGQAPELLAVVAMPADDYARIPVGPDFLGVVFDRPASPGNIGTVVRSADAFGASGVIVTGHGADPYDPKSVRASTGSLFAVPVVRDDAPAGVLEWVRAARRSGVPLTVLGTDENGEIEAAGHDLTGPTLIVVGNETTGLSEAWRAACDKIARIPITGSASSLNAASAATVLLYEAARQRASVSRLFGGDGHLAKQRPVVLRDRHVDDPGRLGEVRRQRLLRLLEVRGLNVRHPGVLVAERLHHDVLRRIGQAPGPVEPLAAGLGPGRLGEVAGNLGPPVGVLRPHPPLGSDEDHWASSSSSAGNHDPAGPSVMLSGLPPPRGMPPAEAGCHLVTTKMEWKGYLMGLKTWFITGTSRGFGREWAIAALDRGDQVAATARDISSLDDLVAKYGDAILPIELDVTDRDADFAAVRQAHERFGRVDIVVNNAGYGQFGLVEELSEQDLREQMETNFFGALWVTQAALPYLRAHGGGHILQVSSIGGISAFMNTSAYHASKWALEGLSQSLAQEVAAFGIKVTLIEPGSFATDWSGPSARHATPLAAYQAVREQAAQARAKRVSAPGDPVASRDAVLRIVDAENPPLRAFLGEGPLGVATADYESRLATWREWQPVAAAAQGRTE